MKKPLHCTAEHINKKKLSRRGEKRRRDESYRQLSVVERRSGVVWRHPQGKWRQIDLLLLLLPPFIHSSSAAAVGWCCIWWCSRLLSTSFTTYSLLFLDALLPPRENINDDLSPLLSSSLRWWRNCLLNPPHCIAHSTWFNNKWDSIQCYVTIFQL